MLTESFHTNLNHSALGYFNCKEHTDSELINNIIDKVVDI